METTGHLIEGWTCTLFAIFLFFFYLNQVEWKNRSSNACKNSVDIFHLSLPPFRAALVPLWAMALQSVREAFFRRIFRFPLSGSNSVSPDFAGAPPVKCSSPSSSFTRVRSPGTEDLSALGSPLGEEDAHADATSFTRALQTIVIPWFDFGVGWPLVCISLKWLSSWKHQKHQTIPLSSQGRALDTQDLGLTSGQRSGELYPTVWSFNRAVRESNAA